MLRDGEDVSRFEFEDVRVDLTGASPVVSISGPSPAADQFRHLIGIMAPGLVIEPAPSAHNVVVGDDSIGVVFTTAVDTTVRYAHAALEIPSGVGVTVEVSGADVSPTGRVTLDEMTSAIARVALGWLDNGGDFLEVYPTTSPMLVFTGDCDTLIEFDPAGNRAASFLVHDEAPASGPGPHPAGSQPLVILASEDPTQTLSAHFSGEGGATVMHLDVASSVITPPLELDSSVDLDLTRLGLAVDHGQGFVLRPRDANNTSISWESGGLRWTAASASGDVFRLLTSNADHRIVPTEDAVIEVEYPGLGDRPLRFSVERFAITKKGIEADARVIDDPIRLNGVDTTFRFVDGVIQVRDSRIEDFSLLGNGALPPALVGDAMADVVIRFQDRGGRIVPVGAGAQLTEDQPLFSPSVLFQYAVDGLGLAFEPVGGGEFHFYFTLTGAATFTPPASFPGDNVLAELASTSIDVVRAPIAGDASRLMDLIDFVVDLPAPATFDVLGCFEMGITSLAFIPEYGAFDGDPGLELKGQIKFADGEGDKALGVDSKHTLVVGAPEPGSLIPRVHLAELSILIEKGDAFKLDVVVSFVDDAERKGFEGEGTLEIKGLPSLAVAVGFMRVRRTIADPWARAWFIAANVGKLTLRVPVLEIYLREIGLGFGYRYTLTSIAALDEIDDLGELIGRLRELSRTAGDLATRGAWSVALEPAGEDARWTIALRALFSQSAAPTSTPIRWDEKAEERIPSAFLFDVLAAIRSDLTFFLAVRAWINTNYHDYYGDVDEEIRGNPLFSGFAVLEPRKQRFLAQLSSNPDGFLGSRPPLPDFVQSAFRNAQISATILIEPNLFHAEMGWPNLLRWQMDFGPMRAEVRAGLIYRLAQRVEQSSGRNVRITDLVLGVSYMARASLRFEAGISIGIAGVSLVATADGAFGARFIGAAQLGPGHDRLDVYGGVGVDIRIRIELQVWINFLFFTKRWRLALEMQFSASLEFGMAARAGATEVGIVGRGTLRIRVVGKSFEVNARIAANPGAVNAARLATARYMSLGLEASDEDTALPGVGLDDDSRQTGPPPVSDNPVAVMTTIASGDTAAPAEPAESAEATAEEETGAGDTTEPASVRTQALTVPGYSAFRVESADATLLVLYPDDRTGGFVPSPEGRSAGVDDFALSEPFPGVARRWDPHQQAFIDATESSTWSAAWDGVVVEADDVGTESTADQPRDLDLAEYLRAAFCADGLDPIGLQVGGSLADPRVENPDESAYESAVRGAIEQFRSSPLFKRDPNSIYEQALWAALHPDTSIYHESGAASDAAPSENDDVETARQLRGMIVESMISDVREYARVVGSDPEAAARLTRSSPAFLLGLVFQSGADWGDDEGPRLNQRIGGVLSEGPSPVTVFNPRRYDFGVNPPRLEGVRTFTDATTVAFSWNLEWATDRTTDLRTDPEQHLAHYEVTRRSLDGSDAPMTTKVKPAEVLAADGRRGWLVTALQPRFQFIDHFGHESAQDVASSSGRSYLYTITPVDVNGTRARPVTVVATRYPSDPPAVPTDTEMTVTYGLDSQSFTAVDDVLVPVTPTAVGLSWTDPVLPPGAPVVAVERHEIVFRREPSLPLGSYGIDSTTSGSQSGSLPTSNARLRPDDVVIEVAPVVDADGPTAEVPIDVLTERRVLPTSGISDSWQVFIRTVSPAGVPSPLVPVQLTLRFENADGRGEERRPPRLEWMTRPIVLPALPPQDGLASAITVHVPRPAGDEVTYQPHPAGTRAIRLIWNQAPSSRHDHPTGIHAGYQLFRIDVDAHPNATFDDGETLTEAWERVDEVRLQPPDELGLVPNTTLNTAEWEAWYPSTSAAGAPESGDHRLLWPPEDFVADGLLHPVLQQILERLPTDYLLTMQVGRPLRPTDLDGFMLATAPGNDPYGWGILQHLGLSTTISARRAATNEVVSGADLVSAIGDVLAEAESADPSGLLRHVFVERLYRPAKAMTAAPGPTGDNALLAIVQLSLRPILVRVPDAESDTERKAHAARLEVESARRLLGHAKRALQSDTVNELEKSLESKPDTMAAWQRRFGVHGPIEASGPHVATAYPLPSAPAIAEPDETGRVRFDQLLPDRWAHAYRYAVKPYSRYARLWDALVQSPAFVGVVPEQRIRPTDPPVVDPADGGIDVRVDRTEPVAPPVIVGSRRLDHPDVRGGVARPGSTWEVLVAPHPDQVLSERNRTVARRLDHRQVAFTVLRSFSHGRSAEAVDYREQIFEVAAHVPKPIVDRVPALEHVDLTDLDEAQRAALSVAERLGGFGVGGLVIQIEHLPFYYDHRLVAIAQTSSDVSAPVFTVQHEFSYRSPEAVGRLVGLEDSTEAGGPASRMIRIELARLWDSLTQEQAARWSTEEPGADGPRLPGSLPDHDVAYDILYKLNGTVSVVARLTVTEEDEQPPRWRVVGVGDTFAIVDGPASVEGPQGDPDARREWSALIPLPSMTNAPSAVPEEPGSDARSRPPELTVPVGPPIEPSSVGGITPAQLELWTAAIYGTDIYPEGDGRSRLAPVVADALDRVAERTGTDELVSATFDPRTPVPTLGWLEATVHEVSFTSLRCRQHLDETQMDQLDEVIDEVADGEFRDALRAARRELARSTAQTTVEGDLSSRLPDEWVSSGIAKVTDGKLVWSGPIDADIILRLDELVAMSPRWEPPLRVIQERLDELIGSVVVTIPPELVEPPEGEDETPPPSIFDVLGDDLRSFLEELGATTGERNRRFVWTGAIDVDTATSLRSLDAPDDSHRDVLDALASGIEERSTPIAVDLASEWVAPRTLDSLNGFLAQLKHPRILTASPVADDDERRSALVWEGPRPDGHLVEQISELIDGTVGDQVFESDVRAFVEALVSGASADESIVRSSMLLEIDVRVGPETTAELGERLVVSDWTISADGFIADSVRDGWYARVSTEADRRAIDLLHRRSLTSDLAGGVIQLRSRRGSAKPSLRATLGTGPRS